MLDVNFESGSALVVCGVMPPQAGVLNTVQIFHWGTK